jgi:hypothetical protein
MFLGRTRLRRLLGLFLLGSGLLCGSVSARQETTSPQKPQRFTRTVAEGVTLIQEIVPEGSPNGPLS